MYEAVRWSSNQVNVYALRKVIQNSKELILKQGKVTSLHIVKKEVELEELLKCGLDKKRPLSNEPFQADGLNEDQRLAGEFVLRSKDAVTGVRGIAGVGKTRTIKTFVQAIGHDRIFSCAPTTEAVNELKSIPKGSVGTMQGFLKNPSQHKTVRNGVIILDEAGMVGLEDMLEMIKIARKQNARLILSGDTGQHGSVPYGDALRQLEEGGFYRYAEITNVLRQKDPKYREAVILAAEKRPDAAMEKLEELEWVSEGADPHGKAVDAYMQILADGKDVLMVAPGIEDRKKVTEMVRGKLRKQGKLGANVPIKVFNPNGWTEEQKKESTLYRRNMTIYFPIKTGDFQAHERVRVTAASRGIITVEREDGRSAMFHPKQLDGFEVGTNEPIPLAAGERLMLKESRHATGGSAGFTNGELVTVTSIDPVTREATLDDGRVLPADYCKYRYAYASTSPSAQGKSITEIIAVVTRLSGKAVNREQFYVSISRGKWSCQLFTDDKKWLEERNRDTTEREFGFKLLDQVPLEQLRAAARMALSKVSHERVQAIQQARVIQKSSPKVSDEVPPDENHDAPDIDP